VTGRKKNQKAYPHLRPGTAGSNFKLEKFSIATCDLFLWTVDDSFRKNLVTESALLNLSDKNGIAPGLWRYFREQLEKMIEEERKS
jgi:hypothetical protein